jgi:hypothetical protein
MTVRITVTRRFELALKGLPPDRARRAANALTLFAREPRLPRLGFRSLSGSPGHFIINASRGDRIILRRESDDHFAAVDVGPHDNVYRRWSR